MIYLMHPLEDAVTVSKIYTIYYLEYTKEYISHGENHDFWELNYADKGTIYVSCGDEEYRIEEGSLILLPPNLHHRLRADGESPSNAFIVSFDAKSAAMDLLGCTVLKAVPVMRDLLKSIAKEGERAFQLPLPHAPVVRLEAREDAPAGSRQIVRMRLEELLIHILREAGNRGETRIFTSRAKFDDAIAARIQAILERERFGPLKLDALTKEIGYGKTYLCGVFKRVCGESIMERHAQLRFQEAKYLLRESGMTVAEVSDRLGFSSPQYFTRFFTRHANMPPAKYAGSVKERWAVAAGDGRGSAPAPRQRN